MKFLSYILFVIFVAINISQAALPLKYLGLGNIIKTRTVKFYDSASDKTNDVNGSTTITTRQPIIVTDRAFFKPSIGANSTRVNSTQGLIVGFVEANGYDNPNSGTYKISYKCVGFRPNLVGVNQTKSARELSGNMLAFAPSHPGTYYMFLTNASMIKSTALSNIATICQAHNTSQLAQEMVVDLRNISTGDPFNLNPASANVNSQRVFTGNANKITVVPPSCLAETASQFTWPTSASSPSPGSTITPTGCTSGIITGSPQRYCIDNGDGTASWGAISGGVCAAQCVSDTLNGSSSNLNLPLPTWSSSGTIYSFRAGDPAACAISTLRLPSSLSVTCTNNGPAGSSTGANWTVTSGTSQRCRSPVSQTASVNAISPSNTNTYTNPYPLTSATWNSHTAAYPKIGVINNMYMASDPTGTGFTPNDGDEIAMIYDLSPNNRHMSLGSGVHWRNSPNGGYIDINNRVITGNTVAGIGAQTQYLGGNVRFMMFGNFVVLQDPVINNGAPNLEWNFATVRAGNLMTSFGYNRYGFNQYHPKIWYWGPSLFNGTTFNCAINQDYPSAFLMNYPITIGIKDNSVINKLLVSGNPVSRYPGWISPGSGPMQMQVSIPLFNTTTIGFHTGPGCSGGANPFSASHPIGLGAFSSSIVLGDRNSRIGFKALILASPNPFIDTYSVTREGASNYAVDGIGWSCFGSYGARATNCFGNNFFYEMQLSNEQYMSFRIRRFIKDSFPGVYDSCPFSDPVANAFGAPTTRSGNQCSFSN